jgi:hypothetical protein
MGVEWASAKRPAVAAVRRQLFLRIDDNYFSRRVASINDVTEQLIVVGGRLQDIFDILHRQLVRLNAIR